MYARLRHVAKLTQPVAWCCKTYATSLDLSRWYLREVAWCFKTHATSHFLCSESTFNNIMLALFFLKKTWEFCLNIFFAIINGFFMRCKATWMVVCSKKGVLLPSSTINSATSVVPSTWRVNEERREEPNCKVSLLFHLQNNEFLKPTFQRK